MDFSTFRLEKAGYHQAQAISDLINQTYRGEVGWTTEAAIIQGDRTDRLEIEAAMTHTDSCFFVAHQAFMLASCIYVAKEKEHAYIGFLSVHPSLQQQGLGKYMLEYAEIFAYNMMQVRKFSMFVVSQRPELIAFYQRRGYRLTGQVKACPLHLGIPKASGLTIDYLEKVV